MIQMIEAHDFFGSNAEKGKSQCLECIVSLFKCRPTSWLLRSTSKNLV
jgi:hypothetical protein